MIEWKILHILFGGSPKIKTKSTDQLRYAKSHSDYPIAISSLQISAEKYFEQIFRYGALQQLSSWTLVSWIRIVLRTYLRIYELSFEPVRRLTCFYCFLQHSLPSERLGHQDIWGTTLSRGGSSPLGPLASLSQMASSGSSTQLRILCEAALQSSCQTVVRQYPSVVEWKAAALNVSWRLACTPTEQAHWLVN